MAQSFKRLGWMLFLSVVFFQGNPLQAGTLTFPGAAPCDTTLQACINGANSGDTVEIVTNERIDDPTLNIDKSLTLKGAEGFFPVIGKANPDMFTINRLLVFNQFSLVSPMNVVLDNINFDNSEVQVFLPNGSGHHFEMTNCRVAFNVVTAVRGIFVIPSGAMTFLIEGNTFLTSNTAVLIWPNPASGTVSGLVQRNSISTLDPANSREGIVITQNTGAADIDIFNNLIFDAGYTKGSINLETSSTADLTVNIKNNTIDNITDIGFQGQGIFFDRRDTSQIQAFIFNNIFSNLTNYAFYIDQFNVGFPDPSLVIDDGHNNFFNLELGVVNDLDFTPDASNLGVDPLYQNSADADYRLRAESELIDAGTNTPPGGLPAVDFLNLPRIAGDTVDIGALESQADLSIVKTANSSSVDLGEDITYTLTVTNGGSSVAEDATITDNLPSGATFVSFTPSQGDCTGTTAITCNLGTLAEGATATVTVVVTADEVGTLTNTASVSSPTADPDADNNSSSVNVAVTDPTVPPSGSSGGCGLVGALPGNPGSLLLFLSPPLAYFMFRCRRSN